MKGKYKTSKKDDSKQFYWIRLLVDFFHKETIDFLMSQKDGSNYVVLYMMLMLMSANTGGRLETKVGEMIIKTDVDKIVRDTKYFSRDTVLIGLELFKSLGLVYHDKNGTLVMPEVPYTVGTITGQTLRKRAYQVEAELGKTIPSGSVGGSGGGKKYQQSIEIRDKSIKTNNKHITLKEKKETKKTKETPKRYTNEIKEIISIYNKIVGSNYTFKNETNNRLIRARLKEGATISDFEKVIKSKYNEWKDTDMKVYIRPSTLFTSKFHDYLAVAGMSKKENETDDFYKQFEI